MVEEEGGGRRRVCVRGGGQLWCEWLKRPASTQALQGGRGGVCMFHSTCGVNLDETIPTPPLPPVQREGGGARGGGHAVVRQV